MKNIIGLLAIAVTTGAVADPLTIQTDQPGSVEIRILNAHPQGQAELRAGNDTGCHVDVWVTGSAQSDGSNWLPNEAGMVAESPCAALHLRANGDRDIRISRGTPTSNPFYDTGPVAERLRISDGTFLFHRRAETSLSPIDQALVLEVAESRGWLMVDTGGNVYAGSMTDDPFHLTAGGSARVTVTGDGAEIWPSSSCPGSIAPAHGGAVFCSDTNGSAWIVTPSGATQIAP